MYFIIETPFFNATLFDHLLIVVVCCGNTMSRVTQVRQDFSKGRTFMCFHGQPDHPIYRPFDMLNLCEDNYNQQSPLVVVTLDIGQNILG